jgi:hypothetical protein
METFSHAAPKGPGGPLWDADFVQRQNVGRKAGNLGLDERSPLVPAFEVLFQIQARNPKVHDRQASIKLVLRVSLPGSGVLFGKSWLATT